MPTYDYECGDCGPFSDVCPMAAFDQPRSCPDCGQPAPRLLTAPALGGGAREPRVAATRAHAGGCACCQPRRLAAEAV